MKALLLFTTLIYCCICYPQFTEKSKIFKSIKKHDISLFKEELKILKKENTNLNDVFVTRFLYEQDELEEFKLGLVEYIILEGDIETIEYMYSIKDQFSNFESAVNSTYPYLIHEFKNEEIKLILNKGADLNGLCSLCNNNRPLDISLSYENLEITKELLNRGVDADYQDTDLLSPLMLSVLLDSFQVAIFDDILSITNDINTSNKDGMSALSFALYYSNDYAAKRLLANGAMLIENDQSNLIASGIMDLFSQYKDDSWLNKNINKWKDQDEDRVIHLIDLAVWSENYKMVKTLLRDYGASINLNANIYENALYYALFLEKEKIAKIILDYGSDFRVDKRFVKQAKKMKYSADIIAQLKGMVSK